MDMRTASPYQLAKRVALYTSINKRIENGAKYFKYKDQHYIIGAPFTKLQLMVLSDYYQSHAMLEIKQHEQYFKGIIRALWDFELAVRGYSANAGSWVYLPTLRIQMTFVMRQVVPFNIERYLNNELSMQDINDCLKDAYL